MNGKYSAGEKSPKTLSKMWEFALAAYSEPIIQRHCLYLQDHYQMDVNMLLAAGFCGQHKVAWTSSLCHELITLVAPIRETYVIPLRALRRQADRTGELYDALKRAEIEAESAEVALLASRIVKLAIVNDGDNSCLKNLLTYAAVFADVSQGQLLSACQELAVKFAEVR
ncbi:MAG: hypothetical protein ACI9SK_001431 [Zhongshania sp.]|jgi:uncharacterized protein (TIGR02444 family)